MIDFHTFSCDSDPFCIVVDPAQIPLAKMTGVRHIVVMKYNIKGGHSLIDHRSGVSVEVGGHKDVRSFSTTTQVLKHLDLGNEQKEVNVYESVGIPEMPCSYPNLTITPEGWIPVLSGEKAYRHFGIKVIPVDS